MSRLPETPDTAQPKTADTPHTHPVAIDQTHAEAAHHGDHGHGSAKSYLIGFVAAAVLTAIPFALTMLHMMPAATLVPVIVAIAVVQILVHLVFFLHMNASSSQVWNNAAFVFAVLVVGILIVGSLWVMYHLNVNMMPGMMPSD